MSQNDPDWEPGRRVRRVHGAEGLEQVQVPEAEDLDTEEPGHTVWLRGRVNKKVDGRWKRDIGRLEKRVYPA